MNWMTCLPVNSLTGLVAACAMWLTALPLAAANPVLVLPEAPQSVQATDDPTAQQLLETAFAQYGGDIVLKSSDVHYELLAHRVGGDDGRHAHLRVRLVSAGSHDAMAIARKLCPGRAKPVDMEFAFGWNAETKEWKLLITNASWPDDPCFERPVWTESQVKVIFTPPAPPQPPSVSPGDIHEPKAGSAERTAILDAIRPDMENFVGAPVKFVVKDMRAAAGFAFMQLHGERPGGKQFEEGSAWFSNCEYGPEESTFQAWARQRGGKWEIAWRGEFCPTDVPLVAERGYLFGAPPELAGFKDWNDAIQYAEREDLLEEWQYYRLYRDASP